MRIGIGQSETVTVLPNGTVDLWEFRPDRGTPLANVRTSAARAAGAPEDFPSISQAIVEGDQVALAVDANVPSLTQVVEGIIDALPMNLIGGLSIVLSDEADAETIEELRSALSSRPEIYIEVHDAENRESLGYLAANTAAEPIYLNRRLLDADLVVPLLVARPAGSLDPATLEGGVFPSFTDSETQRRLRTATLEAAGADDLEAAEAAWLLGIQFVVAVIPNADAQVSRIIAGTPRGIRRMVEHSIASSWQRDTSRKASLVFACIDGDHQQQTWENVGRALHVARHLICPGGTIVLASQLRTTAGRSLRRLTSSESLEKTQARIIRDRGRDALAAALLLQVKQEGRVLLLSKLPVDVVESMGLGAIEHAQQLPRLIDGHESCAIIRAAQFCGIGAYDPDQESESTL